MEWRWTEEQTMVGGVDTLLALTCFHKVQVHGPATSTRLQTHPADEAPASAGS
jgi:hypothetical protein